MIATLVGRGTCLILALGAAIPTAWQGVAAQVEPARPLATPAVTRADVAAAYLRFELAYLASTLDEAETARVNRAFDTLTVAFFARNYRDAIKQLDALTGSIDRTGPLAANPGLAAYCPRLEPAIFVAGSSPPAIRVDRLYELQAQPAALPGILRVMPSAQGKSIDISIRTAAGPGGAITARSSSLAKLKSLKPGRYDVGFVVNGRFLPGSTWSVVSAPPHARQSAYAARLAKLPAPAALAQAVAAVAARNALLTDTPDPANTAQMLIDTEELARQVGVEVAALERGVDPFTSRRGDYWRVIKTDTRDVPVRVYCPVSAPAGRPLPLLVVFHGAGGDENMFMDAYGGGLIKRLADANGLLVASPLTNAFAGPGGASSFERLVEALAENYAIDRARIYALGHSMGGMTVAGLVRAPGTRIAAAACLNGFSWPAGGPDAAPGAAAIPPLFVVAGELDPLSSPARMEPAVKAATDAGHVVDYRVLKNQGHMLSVTKILPDAVAWLLERRVSGDYRPLISRRALSSPTRAHQPMLEGSVSVVFAGVSPAE